MQTLHPLSFVGAALSLALVACGGGDGSPAEPTTEAAPKPMQCPADVPADASCLGGQDSAGAYYMIAMPKGWQGKLVLHAHGGPALGEATMARVEEDLTRWSIMVRAGYAWAGSSFRQGGVAVRAAAEDTERLRRIFVAHVAKPTRTILHGQSWGAGVAAKGAEMFTAASVGERPYDAVLLTSGVLAGGTHSYDFRLDLRVVYQYLCNNHPRPQEPGYALNLGYPAGASISNANVAARTAECLALDQPAEQRTAEQQQKIDTLVKVIKIPESAIQAHLNWGTRHFQDIVSLRTGGASPFGNLGVRYTGSADDDALNAGVQRYAADPVAYARFAEDTDPTGAIPVPVMTTKWIDDPTAFVELDAFFRRTMERAGTAGHLVQTYATEGTHSYLTDATYVTLMNALLRWVDSGEKPTVQQVIAGCREVLQAFPDGCAFDGAYQPRPLESRVPARQRP
ncbi:hypothetical protein CCO03_07690 [Comamonas serinivorans]|uniref:Alpha/beta hydrolase n=1 Tax=Comamonas serinivorans TaxID=1082851 RepID=A0A1Y0ELP6_9BURK|nr:hypothetical protein [Comamonas serinivorans]ARU04574.1 hypothetical protein CCO03_07690 [Comamonas serinivorans]